IFSCNNIMDTQIVEVRKNILISHQFQNVGEISFTRRIDTINFIPDEVVVRQITFNSEDPTDPYYRVVNIYTNLVDDNWIGSIIDIGSIAPQTTFTLRKPISGEYTFQLFNVNRIA